MIKKIWLLIKTTVIAWNDDYVASMGAALAFYTLFSIAPLLLIVLSVMGFVFGAEAARGEIAQQLQNLMGEQSALTVQALLQNANKPTDGMVATIIGVLLLLIGATTVFGELQSALDRIWRVPERLPISGIIPFLRSRLLSFGMIFGIGFILMVSLIFNAALLVFSQWWSVQFKWLIIINSVNLVFSFVMTAAMFALIYKYIPSVKIRWGEVWIGALITAALFTVGKYLIGLYMTKSAVASGFGAAGSVVALLVWVYYSAQIFLLGAEFTWAYSTLYGSRSKISFAEKSLS